MADGEERPRSDRHHLEHAEDVVDRGVIPPLLVAVVQGVNLGENDPEREAGDEESKLPQRVHAAGDRRGWSDRDGEKERRRQPDDIDGDEQPPHEPAPRLVDRCPARVCAVVDESPRRDSNERLLRDRRSHRTPSPVCVIASSRSSTLFAAPPARTRFAAPLPDDRMFPWTAGQAIQYFWRQWSILSGRDGSSGGRDGIQWLATRTNTRTPASRQRIDRIRHRALQKV